jgi:hypothetical protein
MPAKRIAGMELGPPPRAYRYPQANRRNCPPVCCATARRLDDRGSLIKTPLPMLSAHQLLQLAFAGWAGWRSASAHPSFVRNT